jgi:hypothetical protein
VAARWGKFMPIGLKLPPRAPELVGPAAAFFTFENQTYPYIRGFRSSSAFPRFGATARSFQNQKVVCGSGNAGLEAPAAGR